jgi:hypothetical protein
MPQASVVAALLMVASEKAELPPAYSVRCYAEPRRIKGPQAPQAQRVLRPRGTRADTGVMRNPRRWHIGETPSGCTAAELAGKAQVLPEHHAVRLLLRMIRAGAGCGETGP